ncbi:unnamed protein product [Tuber aestivum]|uniref:4a-hydroxytetrahydrobiopterin dehydratase n=1 Tax=Tuber aestivum TaxID=59557 RepID=A0A292PMS0_9PEZI|nr:unnamed protein product [Tuber aestivum]
MLVPVPRQRGRAARTRFSLFRMPLLLHNLLRAPPILIQHRTLTRYTALKEAPRRMSTSTFGRARALAEANEPQWSPGTDEATKKEALGLISGGKWSLSATRMGIEREFKFKTFAKTMIFINQIADQCKVRKHHPDWANVGENSLPLLAEWQLHGAPWLSRVYNKVTIRWTTHSPEGLSYKDVEMAKFCDGKGAELGEIGEGKFEREADK